MSAADVESLLEMFFEEAEEHLAAFEQGLLELETNPLDEEVIARVFRAAHSIKGASGMFGLDDVTSFTHALETLFDKLRQHELVYDALLGTTLLEALDMLKALIRAARTSSPAPAEMPALKASLLRFVPRTAPSPSPSPAAAGAPIAASAPAPNAAAAHVRKLELRFAPKPEFMVRGMDPLRIVRELRAIGELESFDLDTSALPSFGALDPTSMHLAWRMVVSTASSAADLQDLIAFFFVDDLCSLDVREAPPATEAVKPAPRAPIGESTRAAEAPTIRVATDKIDKLLDLVGELVIAQAMLAEAARASAGESGSRLNEALETMDRHTRDLQERVMSIRMVPLASVFRRFPRLVHDMSASIGKKVRLEIRGEETEIDKSMVEKLVDPLTHLVRNAIDHGLESPEERAASGKSDEGTITLTALHEGGNVVIEVADDGRGLDGARIRDKAVRLGLISADSLIGDEQLHAFVFHAGFSTASTVSDISGRGVGMDVVKRNVELLNGSLALATERGGGTRVRVRLPLTLAILDGLAVRVGTQTFIVPLLSVVETFRSTPGQVRRVFGRPEIIDVRGTTLPIVRLRDVFSVPDGRSDEDMVLVCIVETNQGNVAVVVDEVLGQLQVVVKSLEVNFRKVDALMGATIMGDGRVAMIIDVQALASAKAAAPQVPNGRAVRSAAQTVEI